MNVEFVAGIITLIWALIWKLITIAMISFVIYTMVGIANDLNRIANVLDREIKCGI